MLRTSWLLGFACALFLVLGTGQAVASTVTVSPSGAKTLTSTTGVQLTVGAKRVNMTTCTITGTWSSASGTLPLFFSGPTAAASPVDNTRGNMTLTCSGCSITGGLRCTFTCDRQMNLAATAATSGGVTALRWTGIHCTITVAASCSAVLAGVTPPNDGGVNGSYDNATNLLTVLVTGQNLAIVSSSCPATLPTGTAILSSPTAGPVRFLTSPATTITAV
jgi:hypothetical protein